MEQTLMYNSQHTAKFENCQEYEIRCVFSKTIPGRNRNARCSYYTKRNIKFGETEAVKRLQFTCPYIN